MGRHSRLQLVVHVVCFRFYLFLTIDRFKSVGKLKKEEEIEEQGRLHADVG